MNDCYVNNLAKIKVCAVFHWRVIWRSAGFAQIYKPREVTLCWAPLVVLEGHKCCCFEETETSVIQFCYFSENCYSRAPTN